MSRPKIRADAQPLAKIVAECGIDLAVLPPDDDGWHSRESLAQAVADMLNRNLAKRQEPPAGPSMTVTEAYNTGRISPRSVADWEARYAADPEGVGRTLAGLAPVMDAGNRATPDSAVWDTDHDGNKVLRGTYAPSEPPLSRTPLLDDLDRAVYGPSREETYRQQDLEAERQLAEQIRAEREKAAADAAALTDENIDSSGLFGPDRT